jgi:hypothetical protein
MLSFKTAFLRGNLYKLYNAHVQLLHMYSVNQNPIQRELDTSTGMIL